MPRPEVGANGTGAGPAEYAQSYHHVAEQQVCRIGTFNAESLDYLMERLTPADFHFVQYRNLFGFMREMREARQPIGAMALIEWIKTRHDPALIGGWDELFKVFDCDVQERSGPEQAEYWCRDLRAFTLTRRMIAAKHRMDSIVQNGGHRLSREEFEAFQHEVAGLSFDLEEDHGWSDFQGAIDRIMVDAIEREAPLPLEGLPTGFPSLDYHVGGWKKKNLIVLAARANMGKSMLACNFIRHTSKEVPCALFYFEGGVDSLATRIMAIESGVHSRIIRREVLYDRQKQRLEDSRSGLGRMMLYPMCLPTMRFAELRRAVRYAIREYGVQMAFIDHAGHVDTHTDDEQRQMRDVARQAKALAHESDIPVMLIAQLNRQPTMRDDKRPVMSDLRYSGELEQQADTVLLFHRDGYYAKAADRPPVDEPQDAEIIVGKARDEATTTIGVKCILSKTLVYEEPVEIEAAPDPTLADYHPAFGRQHPEYGNVTYLNPPDEEE